MLLYALQLNSGINLTVFFIVIFIVLIFLIVLKNKIIQEKSKKIKITKDIIDNIHKNFNIKNIKENSVQSIGSILEADRCLIVEYNTNTKKFSKINTEYLSSSDELSLKGDLPSVQANRITNVCINNTILNIPNTAKYISDNYLQDTLIESFYQKYHIKSILAVQIRHSGKVLGAIVLHYTKKIKTFTPDDIQFVKGIADSVGIALYQSNLYEEQKNIAKRDSLLRQITETIRVSLDINEMKQNIVDEICKTFNADRCYLREYNQKENIFSKPEAEYLASGDIESLKDKELNQKALNTFFRQMKAEKGFMPLEITKDYFAEKIVSDPDLEEYFEQANIKSCFIVPIWDKKGELTFLDLHYIKDKIALNNEDKELLIVLAKQISIALEQSFLYAEAKIQSERESTTRKIVDIIRSTLEPNNILLNVAEELLKYFDGVQRVFIVKGNLEKKEDFIEVAKNPDIKKATAMDEADYNTISKYWINYISKYKTKKVVNNIEKSDLPQKIKELYQSLGVKSLIMLPVNSREKISGGLFLSSIYNYKKWTEDEIIFLESIITQLDIAIKQADLFEKLKSKIHRETLLRKVTEATKRIPDIKAVKQEIVNLIGKAFDADRCYVRYYDKIQKLSLKAEVEYRKSDDVISVMEVIPNTEGMQYFIEESKRLGKLFVIKDADAYFEKNNLQNAPVADYLNEIHTKSDYPFVAWEDEKNIINIALHYTKKPHYLSQEEIDFIGILVTQAGYVINQSKLFEKEKETAQREQLLRKIIEIIRSSIDIEFIKHEIVNQIGIFLNADRVAFADYNFEKENYLTSENNEYRSSPSIKTFVGIDFASVQGFSENIRKTHIRGEDIIFSDLDKYLEETNLKNSEIENFYKEMGFASSMAINIYSGDLFFGNLVITFEEKRNLSEDDIKFIKTITNQASIAIYQSTLYQKEKQTAQRESFLRQIIETIRSSLDIKQIKKSVVYSIGNALNADICLLVEGDKYTEKLSVPDEFSEYRASDNFPSFIGVDFEQAPEIQFIKKLNNQEKELLICDSEKFIQDNNLQGSLEEKFFNETQIKTSLGISLFYQKDFIGILLLFFMNDIKYFSEEDKDFARTLAVQAGNALYQSKLYEFQRKIAFKERILKDIISEIKFSRDLNHAYNKLLQKLSEIFMLNRALFLESSKINPDELDIKYEYVIHNKDLSVNNLVFPKICIEQFLNLVNNLEPLIIEDVNKCQPKEVLGFFNKYKINSLLSVPLVKFNGETRVLGFIVLCSENVRIWTNEEIDLIQSVCDSVVSVIWEISKFLETEELRNSFVLTLAHDFQVPLVGERTALEYLLNYSDCSFGRNQDILKEILENNQNISTLLDKFVDIYNYELGKKHLVFENIKLIDILNEAIFSAKIEADARAVKIIFKPAKEDYCVKIDKREMSKVFSIVINNAITHSLSKKEVTIKYYKKNYRVIISINNKGKPIPLDVQEKLFKRYEMAVAIERKIGAGTGLFLSKRIIEAHKGYIWFETTITSGTTFYISLPLSLDLS